jgi:hypothetical protein
MGESESFKPASQSPHQFFRTTNKCLTGRVVIHNFINLSQFNSVQTRFSTEFQITDLPSASTDGGLDDFDAIWNEESGKLGRR